MSGRGSGRHHQDFTRSTVEGCRSVDVRRWQREKLLTPGNYFGWIWRDEDGEKTAGIGVYLVKSGAQAPVPSSSRTPTRQAGATPKPSTIAFRSL
jgi:hypothetical protein